MTMHTRYPTPAGMKILKTQKYFLPEESYDEFLTRVSTAFQDNVEHGKRIKRYMEQMWFYPSTPVLSTAGTNRGLPISCFLNHVDDNMDSIATKYNEIFNLARYGGGIGTNWSSIRSVGSPISKGAAAGSVIAWMKVQDSLSMTITQGGTFRHGAMAVFLKVSHPEIMEFLSIRRQTGGDLNRKCLNLHHGVIVDDAFMHAVEQDLDWDLKDKTLKARQIWQEILTTRLETGEPYITFIDTINSMRPEEYIKSGLFVNQSNLCQEITLHTSPNETAVCCLSSLNFEYYDEWKTQSREFLEDVLVFLSNVMQTFIMKAPDSMHNALTTAIRERSVGLGAMGFHTYLQNKMIPYDSEQAEKLNIEIFSSINNSLQKLNKILGTKRGVNELSKKAGTGNHFTHVTAIAPTATISIIAGETSEGIIPIISNAYNNKTIVGTTYRKNKSLERLLESKNINTEEIWKEIMENEGSVQSLDELTQEEKDVFKTAFEIDQYKLIKMAGDRQKYIDQGQSLNIFLKDNISKRLLNDLHLYAWKRKVKTLYYLRSNSSHKVSSVCNRCQ